MVQYIESYKKNIAIDMRKKGMSYSDIQNRINIPKSTLSFWLKKIKLTAEQKKKLEKNRLESLKRGSEKRISKIREAIDEVRKTSAQNIRDISKKELWLMGAVLYWRERLLSGNEEDLKKGVKFTSSDPYLIKLFLKWLKEIGQIEDDELTFDIFIDKRYIRRKDEAIRFWSDVVEYPKSKFTKIYYHKIKRSEGKSHKKRMTTKNKTGLLRIRVKASSMLARQIAGWVRGIIKYYWH